MVLSLPPDEIVTLMESNKKWDLESNVRSIWEYDKNNNPIGFYRDEKAEELEFLKDSSELGVDPHGRIITQKSTSEFENIDDKFYLTKTTEWLPRFNEPLKETKEYIYTDKNGNILNPSPA